MSNDHGSTIRVRGLVGRNIAALLEAQNMRQEDLSTRVRAAGAADWPQETVSRYVKGTRALTLEDTVVLAAALGVPFTRLLIGGDHVTLLGNVVLAAQVRDVVQHGRVQADSANGSVLDALALGEATEVTAVEQQLADTLQVTVREVVNAAYRLWDLPPDDELESRMRKSREAFTGSRGGSIDAAARAMGQVPQTTHKQERAWRGHHVAVMAKDLALDVQVGDVR